MAMRLETVACDTTDPTTLAGWWADQVGGQHVDEPTAGKSRWHLDLAADDLEAEVERSARSSASRGRTAREARWADLRARAN
ncbi:VOC family protein [Nocardioides sp. C4-1]|uniref:VOC family protein n=1 Tax=Nocardioides sp. C4-1 TaxID=3151851 RepID=UPI00326702FC